ncbi:MAG: UDP-N-acetylmuramate--L-alanine ligase, partial [Elusimicrobia bacterium]|nr:UDP-N-acetylmuramate--L-alanine ligase [Elusimicrobiota bacterium]
MFRKIKNIHFIGIGGSGMSGIAEVFHNLGYTVTGSDAARTSVIDRLKKLGIAVASGHHPSHIGNAHVVVTSTAINHNNSEIKQARKQGIPVIPRIEMLAELARLKYAISVAGTHGKTTTTSMLALVMRTGGLDPTIVVGGIIKNIGTGAQLGKGDYLIAEADESDGSFLKLSPTLVIVTNIDNDHVDYYGNMDRLSTAFVEHVNRIPFYGSAIMNVDDSGVRAVMNRIKRNVVTYGSTARADYWFTRVRQKGYTVSYDVMHEKKSLGTITLHVPGDH